MSMQVILKSTLACNGTCVYCAASATPDSPSTMREEDLPGLFAPFARWLRGDPSRVLGFIWHGGEPLVHGLRFFEAARRAQVRAFGDDLPRVQNSMQSNLTLLTPEWIPFLKGFLQGLGTSFDLVEGIRGLKDGDPLPPRWLRAVRLCREAGIDVGVVYVVHRRSLPIAREIYRFFRNLDPRGRMRLNPLYREGRGADSGSEDLAITSEEYGRFLLDVAEDWWPDRERTSVMPISEWFSAWKGDASRLCCDSGGRCQETHLGVCPDGSTYGCGRASDSTDEALRLGNVFTDDLEAMIASPARARLATRGALLRESACRDCTWWPVCHGGCPMDARIYHGDEMRETYFCEGRKRVYEFLAARLGPPAAPARRGPALVGAARGEEATS